MVRDSSALTDVRDMIIICKINENFAILHVICKYFVNFGKFVTEMKMFFMVPLAAKASHDVNCWLN